LVLEDKGKGKEQHIAGYNTDTNSEFDSLIHQDAEVSTTAKWIFDSGASIHMMPDAGLLQDIRPIQSKVRVGNGIGIHIYGIGTVALFVVLKDRSNENVMLKDVLYIPGLMKLLFSWSKLKFFNQHYLENRGNMLVRKILNDKVILWARECPCTHLFNIPTKSLEAYKIYTFWHKALRHPSYHLIKYVNMFSDSNLISSKPKDFDYNTCLQSNSTHKVPKTLQDYVKLKFDIIHSDVHSLLAIESLGGKRYFVMFIDKFS
jgi:hypothetical protein